MRVLQWNIFSTFVLLGILIACECRKKVDSKGWRYL